MINDDDDDCDTVLQLKNIVSKKLNAIHSNNVIVIFIVTP